MRNYKRRMEQYRLPKERVDALRRWCRRTSPTAPEIERALSRTTDEVLAGWIRRNVTGELFRWRDMELAGLPCSRDTFRVYRACFFWELDRELKTGRHSRGRNVLR